MAKRSPIKKFVEDSYRAIAKDKDSRNSGTRLRATDRLAVMCGALNIALRDQEPRSGEPPEKLPVVADNVSDSVKKMLDQQAKDRKRGGDNADKLPQSGS